jgi:ABC-type branched-subunit amino acid transport system permease subunit
MSFLEYLLLSYGMPVLLALACAACWWRTFRTPGVFLLVAVLALLGLEQIVASSWRIGTSWLGVSGLYPEFALNRPFETLFFSGLFNAVVTCAVGFFVLRRLQRALNAP